MSRRSYDPFSPHAPAQAPVPAPDAGPDQPAAPEKAQEQPRSRRGKRTSAEAPGDLEEALKRMQQEAQ